MTFIGQRFADHNQKVRNFAALLLGKFRHIHAEQRIGGVRAISLRQILASDLGIPQIRVRGIFGTIQQLFAIDDLDHASRARAVGEVDAIAFRSGGDCAVQVGGRGTSGAGLLPRQAEIANENGLRGIAEIVDLRHAARAPTGTPQTR